MTDEAPAQAQPTQKPPIDWERIEDDYRAGLLSLREIAALHPGVSHVAIKRRADKLGWTRDLTAKIKAKADDLVTRDLVTLGVTEQRSVTDRAIIEANAEVIAGIRLAHRKDIGRARALAVALLAELEAQTGSVNELRQLADLIDNGEDLSAPGITEKMQGTFMAVLSLPGRTKTMKDLAETLHKLIGLEREAYSIGPQEAPTAPPMEPASAPTLVVQVGNAQSIYLDMIHRKA